MNFLKKLGIFFVGIFCLTICFLKAGDPEDLDALKSKLASLEDCNQILSSEYERVIYKLSEVEFSLCDSESRNDYLAQQLSESVLEKESYLSEKASLLGANRNLTRERDSLLFDAAETTKIVRERNSLLSERDTFLQEWSEFVNLERVRNIWANNVLLSSLKDSKVLAHLLGVLVSQDEETKITFLKLAASILGVDVVESTGTGVDKAASIDKALPE